MCIIVTKDKGAKALPEKVFENCWDNNPDGAGILYNDGTCTTLIKGIMKKEEFLKKVKEANKKECSFVIHTRIATHGSVKPTNTHPFVSKSLGFAHNGTLPVEVSQDMTDSETFFLNTIADKDMNWVKDNIFLLDLATRGSRCAVFDMATGEIVHLNEDDWVKDESMPGAMFSGKSYSYQKYDYSKLSYGRYGSYGYPDYDDDDEWWDYYNYNKSYGTQSKKEKKDYMPKQYFKDTAMGGIKRSNAGLYLDYETVTRYLPKLTTANAASPEAKEFRKNNLQVWDELYKEATEYYDDDYVYTQALKIIRLFYGIAYSHGHYHIDEVDQQLEKFLNDLKVTTLEEANLVSEIKFQVGIDTSNKEDHTKNSKKEKKGELKCVTK